MKAVLNATLALALSASVSGQALAAENAAWGYSGPKGPDHWGKISKEYGTCTTGQMQSPIDLAQANALGDIKIKNARHKTDTGPLSSTDSVGFLKRSALNGNCALPRAVSGSKR